MSQAQPERPQPDQFPQQEPIKYGDVFNVCGELASKPIVPQDAATMQSAESQVFGHTQKGGPAVVMQSAAIINQKAGLVGSDDVTNVASKDGVAVSETKVGGNSIVTETVGGQVVGQYVEPEVPINSPGRVLDRDSITIGEALEATALSAGDKPVKQTDAAAIQAAEVRATGSDEIPSAGIGAMAQSAATLNTRTMRYANQTKLSDVISVST
ncbi:Late embryogenesis abundant protein D-34 [Quillaja saponaria]|uniref:Late embryogenesis abundant protein D-34 n=1 Tax=Quillaja saponaria TaxID=32244 RepID=A0AAD7VEP3_QUISA|nr:Late embryogenesis abundant protein D-34 [Quillaja saponaria]